MRFRGQVEGIGVAPHLKISNGDGVVVTERSWPAEGFDHDVATRELLKIGRALLEGAPPSDLRAGEAIALFIYRIVREIGSLTAALGGLDGIVLSGEIGENDAATRAELVDSCG
jgi:butyrate kinase